MYNVYASVGTYNSIKCFITFRTTRGVILKELRFAA